MADLPFHKMQGLGNDFVVFQGPLALSPEQIAWICDRRLGVGADGVLVVTPGDPIRMEYWNADGGAAEMCGNGLRCVARFALDKGMSEVPRFEVDTPSGVRQVEVRGDYVEVELGPVKVTGHTTIDGARYHLIDVGNPHAVSVVDDPERTEVDVIGPKVEHHHEFPFGTNVEFAVFEEAAVRLRVWERGVGETRACGTGMAAAAMVATKLNNLEGPIPVTVPGGTGTVEFREGSAWLFGPAEYSFSGVAEV